MNYFVCHATSIKIYDLINVQHIIGPRVILNVGERPVLQTLQQRLQLRIGQAAPGYPWYSRKFGAIHYSAPI